MPYRLVHLVDDNLLLAFILERVLKIRCQPNQSVRPTASPCIDICTCLHWLRLTLYLSAFQVAAIKKGADTKVAKISRIAEKEKARAQKATEKAEKLKKAAERHQKALQKKVSTVCIIFSPNEAKSVAGNHWLRLSPSVALLRGQVWSSLGIRCQQLVD